MGYIHYIDFKIRYWVDETVNMKIPQTTLFSYEKGADD